MTDVVDIRGNPVNESAGEKKVDEQLCTMLEQLLQEARSGNLTCIAFVTGHWNGETTAGIGGEFTMAMVGEAHTLAHCMSMEFIAMRGHEEP